MNKNTSRANRANFFVALLGGASIGALASSGAYAAAAAGGGEVVSEVTITGSLIAGAPAVGVPVTQLSGDDFIETGALNVLELLESQPALIIPPTNSPAFGAGTLHFANNVQIHGLGVGDTLMMVDGRRWPLQGYDGERVDPAIIPQIAVDRVDVLTAGASATYGADATAGVVNIILRRGYDGAQSFVRTGGAFGAGSWPGGGNFSVTFAQLYGRSWDTGNITVSYEHQRVSKVEGDELPWYTWNFSESGFKGFDFTQISMSEPGIVSTGRTKAPSSVTVPARLSPDRQGGIYCGNCYTLPDGIGWDYGDQDPAPATTWAAIIGNPGVKPENIRNPWHDGWSRPMMEANAATLTFDEEIIDNLDVFGMSLGSVSLQVDGLYSNRRFKQEYPTDQGQGRENMSPIRNGYTVPTNNPYYPTGVPSGTDLRIHFNLGDEIDTPIVSGGQTNGRWLAGLNFDELPYGWHGNIFYTQTENFSYGYDRGGIIPNMASAALGNVVEIELDSPAGTLELVKPAGIPYLNPFCDSNVHKHCNSPLTINYMRGYRNQYLSSHFTEFGTVIDGPVFDLPAGPIQVALGYSYLTKNLRYYQEDNTNSEYAEQIVITGDYLYEVNNAFIAQANIPLVGGDMTLPLMESLDVELGYRRDWYDNLEKAVNTPKVAVNWGVGMGLTLRGSWGKSFRTPKGEEISKSGAGVQALNLLGGFESIDSTILECDGATPTPGTLTAVLNPTCDDTDPELFAPALISVSGPPVLTGPILEASGLAGGISTGIGPQRATQYNLGFNFTPGPDNFGGVLNGLTVDATYWHLDYKDLIGSTFRGEGPNDPLSFPFYIVIPNPTAPITDPSNADFYALVKALSAVPTRTSRAPDSEHQLNVKAIEVSLNGNIGLAELAGVDFSARWDFDVGDWGTFHVGAAGYYEHINRTKGAPEDPAWADPYQDLLTSGNKLKKVRYRAGWTDGTWNVVTFFNYYGHSAQDMNGLLMLPRCFYAEGSGPGSCYPGSPYYGPYEEFPLHSPANVLVDLQIGYNTGIMPANTYLQNINLSLSVTNLLDKTPPLGVHPLRSRGTGVAGYDRNYPDLTREISFTVTKVW